MDGLPATGILFVLHPLENVAFILILYSPANMSCRWWQLGYALAREAGIYVIMKRYN